MKNTIKEDGVAGPVVNNVGGGQVAGLGGIS